VTAGPPDGVGTAAAAGRTKRSAEARKIPVEAAARETLRFRPGWNRHSILGRKASVVA
jgi:hypothetical protein